MHCTRAKRTIAAIFSSSLRSRFGAFAVLLVVVNVTWIGARVTNPQNKGGSSTISNTFMLSSAQPLCPAVSELRADLIRRWTTSALPRPCTTFGKHFPSLGGPGCPCPCADNAISGSSATVYWSDAHAWPDALYEHVTSAVQLLKRFGPLKSADAETGRDKFRIVLSYHCCVGKRSWPTIKAVADAFPWRALRVQFAPVACAISAIPDRVDLILPLEAESSLALEEEAVAFEAALAARGVNHVPRAHLQPHHMTLAVVNATLFPVTAAIAAINAQYPAWTDTSGIELQRARCHLCDKLAARQGVALKQQATGH
jgi:hypothetical protein